jgi:opacity protein-like surface antigen
MVLFTTAVSAEQDLNTYLQSTNHLTLSLRFGLNISGKFSGVGSGLFLPGSAPGNGQLTPDGDPYNYDDGYNLTPSASPNPAYTTYWGYDNIKQLIVDPVNGYTGVQLSQTTATGISTGQSGEDSQNAFPGFELSYDREFGEKANWHDMHYGLEGAVNYMKISLNDSGVSSGTSTTTTYDFLFEFPTGLPLIPPSSTAGSGITPGRPSLSVSPSSVTTGAPATAAFFSQDQFSGDLWGFRLGPYLDFPMSEKWSLHLSGGLAVGLLDDSEEWQQTLNTGAGTFTASGQGTDFRTLWGYYVSLDAEYQINKRWGVEGGVQYEDLGQYSHSFSGRTVQLDLSQSLFVQVGVSYSF